MKKSAVITIMALLSYACTGPLRMLSSVWAWNAMGANLIQRQLERQVLMIRIEDQDSVSNHTDSLE